MSLSILNDAVSSYAKQIAATAICNNVFGGAQGGLDSQTAQRACGMAVPAMQAAASYVVHKFSNPEESYPMSQLFYDAAGTLGGAVVDKVPQSAVGAALTSAAGSAFGIAGAGIAVAAPEMAIATVASHALYHAFGALEARGALEASGS